MEQVRANGGGDQRPLIPAPGNGTPTNMLPQYAFHMTMLVPKIRKKIKFEKIIFEKFFQHRQRLEAMYPAGTFSNTYFRTAPMPPPRALMVRDRATRPLSICAPPPRKFLKAIFFY